MIPETPANIAAAQKATRDIPDAAVISKVSFSDQLKRDFGSRFLILMVCSIGGALLMALAVFRRIKYLILAALPVMFAFAVLIVLSVMFSFKINAAAGFALILLAGLAIDYGVYSVHLLENPEKTSIRRSLFLAAATTVAGSGALLFSKHPVLFGTGIVLSCGVAAASFCGLYLIPKIAGASFSKKRKTLPRSAADADFVFLFIHRNTVGKFRT
jgi:predicted RND superfamily exporter protein